MTEQATITALSPLPDKAQRIRIHVGRRAVATLSSKAVADLQLAVGQPWDEVTAAKVRQAVGRDRVMRHAMRIVNRRMTSGQELQRKLHDKGHDAEVIAEVIERLQQTGAVDDETLGRALIRELRLRKPAGPALLRQKLRQRGLDRQLIDRLLVETAEDDPVASARRLAQQQCGRLMRLDPQVRKRRLWGVLARRGFDSDVITQVIESIPELSDPYADEQA